MFESCYHDHINGIIIGGLNRRDVLEYGTERVAEMSRFIFLNGHKPTQDERTLINRVSKLGWGIIKDETGWRLMGIDEPFNSLVEAVLDARKLEQTEKDMVKRYA